MSSVTWIKMANRYHIPVLLRLHENLSGLGIQGVLRNLGHPHYQQAQDDLITKENTTQFDIPGVVMLTIKIRNES